MRRSIPWPPTRIETRPSCGRRRSAMSSSPMILRRLATLGRLAFGTVGSLGGGRGGGAAGEGEADVDADREAQVVRAEDVGRVGDGDENELVAQELDRERAVALRELLRQGGGGGQS